MRMQICLPQHQFHKKTAHSAVALVDFVALLRNRNLSLSTTSDILTETRHPMLYLAFKAFISSVLLTRDVTCNPECLPLETCNKSCFGLLKDSNNCAICECDEEKEMMDDMKLTPLTRGYLDWQFRTDKYEKMIQSGVQFDASSAKIPKWDTYPTKRGTWKIPYVIDATIDKVGRKAIKKAIADFENFICFKFVKRRDQENYLFFSNNGGGCWSYVGRRIGEKNQIQIGAGCSTKGIVIHEIMHALGFFHEQQRPDRDEYVTVHWSNMKAEFASNFRKKTKADVDSLGSPYDIYSIMHYTDEAFSKNGKRTITTKDGQGFEAQRDRMAETDIQQLRLMYKCPGATVPPPTMRTVVAKPATKPVATKLPKTTPSTTFSPTVEETTFDLIDGDCEDSYHQDCEHLASLGLCTDPLYRQQAKDECEKTCGFCDCYDHYEACERWVFAGDCASPGTFEHMIEDCPLSCGFCGKACADMDEDCELLEEFGLCSDDESLPYMVEYCPKVCGFCYDSNDIEMNFVDDNSWF